MVSMYVLWNPEEMKFEPVVEHENEETLKFMYRVLDCDLVEAVSFSNGITAWVDEEGLYKQQETFVTNFDIDESVDPRFAEGLQLVGKVLFTGSTKEGETIPLDDNQAFALLKFINVKEVGRLSPR